MAIPEIGGPYFLPRLHSSSYGGISTLFGHYTVYLSIYIVEGSVLRLSYSKPWKSMHFHVQIYLTLYSFSNKSIFCLFCKFSFYSTRRAISCQQSNPHSMPSASTLVILPPQISQQKYDPQGNDSHIILERDRWSMFCASPISYHRSPASTVWRPLWGWILFSNEIHIIENHS